MSSFPPTCTITENPDIAGIGVRVSIYLPAILVTLNSGYVTAKVFVDVITGGFEEYVPPPRVSVTTRKSESGDGEGIEMVDLERPTPPHRSPSPVESTTRRPSIAPSWNSDTSDRRMLRGYLTYLSDHPHYFESAKALERSLFLIGSAIIVSAFLDARFVTSSIGLSPYHALLVLNLSLLNNFAGSSFFVFRIGSIFAIVELDNPDEDEDKDKPRGISIMSKTIWWIVQFFDVFGLSTLQTVVIIVFGIWFWVSTTFYHSFSGYSMSVGKLLSSATFNATVAAEAGGSSNPLQCVSETFYWAFLAVRIESTLSIQIISFVFYIGTALVPFLGPLVTVIPTIILFKSVPIFLGLVFSGLIYFFGIIIPRLSTRLIYDFLPKLYHLPNLTLPYPHPTQPFFPTRLSPSATSTKLIFGAMMITNLSTVVFLIISTEKVIFINSALRNGGTVVLSGGQWTYGQTLALLSAAIGVLMYGAEVVGHWREARVERRKRMRENFEALSSTQKRRASV
ncbi:hypothetical protein GGU10DRAFT_348896 [Lentinula aff. detonsa]|uniref:Uncharacterized protein n=1 Tax=Lentinula aff. detonsa TaxID=2804958 RepID=A0AA38KR57_9AGAR|nr:hypothetical protein GGU10DRAFT_348896 [Lentinula aff. detonsa]